MRSLLSGSRAYRGSVGSGAIPYHKPSPQAMNTDIAALGLAGIGVTGPGLGGEWYYSGRASVDTSGATAEQESSGPSALDFFEATLQAAPDIITAVRGDSSASVGPQTSSNPASDYELERLRREYAAAQQELIAQQAAPKQWIQGVDNTLVVVGLGVLLLGGLVAFSTRK